MTVILRFARLLLPLLGRAVVAAVTLLVAARRKPSLPPDKNERR